AHPAGHPDALEDARRIRARADRARLADVVRAVRDRAAAEVVPLDRSLEALADPDPGDLDLVARLEDLDGHVLALDGFREVPAELDQVAERAVDAGLAQVAELGLRKLALGHRVVGELDGLVAVGVRSADGDDGARARLDHGHRGHAAALLVEELRHAELASENPAHLQLDLDV